MGGKGSKDVGPRLDDTRSPTSRTVSTPRSDVRTTSAPGRAFTHSSAAGSATNSPHSSVTVAVASSTAVRSGATSPTSTNARSHDRTVQRITPLVPYLGWPVQQEEAGARPKEFANRDTTASHLTSSSGLYHAYGSDIPKRGAPMDKTAHPLRQYGDKNPLDPVSYGEFQELKPRVMFLCHGISGQQSARRYVSCETHGTHCDLTAPFCAMKSMLKSTCSAEDYPSPVAETSIRTCDYQNGRLPKGYKRFGTDDMMGELRSYLLRKGMDKELNWNLVFTEFASAGFIRFLLLSHACNIRLPLSDSDTDIEDLILTLTELELSEKQASDINIKSETSLEFSNDRLHEMETRDGQWHTESESSQSESFPKLIESTAVMETKMSSKEYPTETKAQVPSHYCDGDYSGNSSLDRNDTTGGNAFGNQSASTSQENGEVVEMPTEINLEGIHNDTADDSTFVHQTASTSRENTQDDMPAVTSLTGSSTASSPYIEEVKCEGATDPSLGSSQGNSSVLETGSKPLVSMSILADAVAAEILETHNAMKPDQSTCRGKDNTTDDLRKLADVVAAEIRTKYGNKSATRHRTQEEQKSKQKSSSKMWIVSMVLPHRIEKGVLISYIKETLAIILSHEDIEIDPTDNQKTKVRVTFQNRKEARDALRQFKRDQMIDRAYLSHHSGSVATMTAAEQNDYIENEWESLTRKTVIPVSKHEDKIELIRAEQAKYMPRKAMPLHEFERTQQQREALSYKLKELELQKDVFTSYMAAAYEEMKMLKCEEISPMVERIRIEFVLELNRFSSALPMYAKKTDIIRTVCDNQVSVILGETGSGKSTQMVQYLHQAGLCNHGKIVCTQPRKVAAISLAQHVSKEMGDSVGRTVGYQVGMSSKCSSITKVIYVTDHVLLNHCLRDPDFNEYSCIIIDEAHERSIYTDLLLGMIKKALPKRHDLKVVVTSATIDPEVFVKYFNGCPVLRVSGRTFPVSVEYANPIADEKPQDINENYVEAAVDKALEVHERATDGDILVFLTSPLETEKASDMLARKGRHKMSILQLHGRLQPRQQQQVFEPAPVGTRKVVFATNSAETSITIPGIQHVVDTGLAKEMCYDPNRNINSLEVRYISKSSAEQRKGRAGRTQAGTCYRLYSETTFDGMQPSSVPEILRTHLGLSLLQLLVLGIEDVGSFDFVQSPPQQALQSAMDTLDELGATKDGRITDTGRKMAKLPIEPRLAKLVLSGIEAGVGFATMVTAAVCSSGNIFFRGSGANERDAADKQKARFCQEGGDVLTLVDVYYRWLAIEEKQKNAWCVTNSINAKSMRLARETVDEIHKVLSKELNVKVKYGGTEENLPGKLPALLFQCFKTNLAYFTGNRRSGYIVAHRPTEILHVHPSAVQILLNQNPKWVIFERILRTSRQFMLNLTPVDETLILEMCLSKQIVLDPERIIKIKVHPILANVGSFTLRYLVGPKCNKLRELEASIKENQSDQVGEISTEVNFPTGQVTIHTNGALSHEAFDSLQENLAKAKEELATMTVEHSIQGQSSVRYVLGAGGTVRTLLMPWQFRSLIVCEVPHGAEHQDVLDHFSAYGQVESHVVFRNDQSGKPTKLWGKITYAEECQAKEASRCIQKDDLDDTCIGYRVRPEKSHYQGSDDFQARVKIEWCRRQHRGFGFVTCNHPEDAVYITSHSCRLCVRGTYIKATISNKNPEQVFLKGVPKTANERDIKDRMEEQFPGLIDKVMLPRENVPETTNSDLDMYRKRLTSLLSGTLEDAEYTIELLKPSTKAFIFRGFLRFEDPSKAQTVVDTLSDNISMDTCLPLSMVLELQSSVIVPGDLWPFVHESLEDRMEHLKLSEDNVQFTVLQPKMGGRRIRISSSSSASMAVCKSELCDILQGTSIPITTTKTSQAIRSLNGQHALDDIRKQTQSFIRLDRRSSSLMVLGSDRSQAMATRLLKEYLQNAEELKTCEIRLSGKDRPVGLLKEFITRFGLNGEELVRRCELHSVAILLKQHAIRLHGNKESVERAQSIINEMSSNLPNVIQTEEEEECCPVCMCPVENLFRLEFCGDAYCLECISNLVQNGIDSKTFPLTCAKPDCNLVMSLEDIQGVVGRTQSMLEPVAHAAIECHVRENGDDWKYCITPDCPMVYKVSESSQKFCCPCCSTAICTSCHVQFHYGLTCAMYESIKRDKDPDLKDWQSGNPGHRTFCPGCRRPIEKNEGCMHMICGYCKVHFCWRCKKSFGSARATYDHLSTECGGIF